MSGRRIFRRFREPRSQSGFDAGLVTLDLETIEAVGIGEFAHEVGRYTVRTSAGDTVDRGKYVVVWRNVGGQWYLHRDIWNSSQPAPADTTAM